MKFKSLMDIPIGYEMELANDGRFSYSAGTTITRGHKLAGLDDESSVAFTYPDGEWYYLDKTEIREIQSQKEQESEDECMGGEVFSVVNNFISVFDSAGNCVADIHREYEDVFEITISQYLTDAKEWPKISEKIQQCLVMMKGGEQ